MARPLRCCSHPTCDCDPHCGNTLTPWYPPHQRHLRHHPSARRDHAAFFAFLANQSRRPNLIAPPARMAAVRAPAVAIPARLLPNAAAEEAADIICGLNAASVSVRLSCAWEILANI